ncbi:MAG: glycosyltransferase family 9 protein [Nitrospinota bacterium]|nr:glycosyltransferase family 9 protein [Nitrospinota bacterium]
MNFDLNFFPANPRILLVRLRSIGDVTLSTAVFPPIKERFPDGKLDYVVISPNQVLVEGNPHLNEIIMLEGPGPLAFLKLIKRLRKKNYDLVIDLHGGPRSGLITALTKARFKAGLARSRRSGFYNVTVDPVFDRSVPAVRFQNRMLELLGFTIRQEVPKIYITRDETESMAQRLEAMEIRSEYAVIHPGVDSLHNEWQAEKFSEVADALQSSGGINTVFASAPNQTRQVEDILVKMKTPGHSLAGETTLREFAALVNNAKFLFCHNSGPMHIAAALGTPVFALFGSVAPERWIPQVEPHHVFYKNIECSPCIRSTRKSECFSGNAECKRLISAGEVIEAIGRKLNLPSLITPSQAHRD